jgi:hypothetical protein
MRRLWLTCVFAGAAFAEQTDWITSLGGTFAKNQAGSVVEVDLTSTWVTDDDLAKLAQMPELRKINLSDTKI